MTEFRIKVDRLDSVREIEEKSEEDDNEEEEKVRTPSNKI